MMYWTLLSGPNWPAPPPRHGISVYSAPPPDPFCLVFLQVQDDLCTSTNGHLVAITGDLLQLVHLRIPPTSVDIWWLLKQVWLESILVTGRNEFLAKVMFFQASVILSTGGVVWFQGGVSNFSGGGSPIFRACSPGVVPGGGCLQFFGGSPIFQGGLQFFGGGGSPTGIWSTFGQYASYWNAFLFI